MGQMNTVTMSLEDYDNMKEAIFSLREENANLTNALEAIKEEKEQKVIVKEITTYEDGRGNDVEETFYAVKGFDEVKQEVEEFYKEEFEKMKERVAILDETIESQKKVNEALAFRAADAELELELLKHRTLWQRIWNK